VCDRRWAPCGYWARLQEDLLWLQIISRVRTLEGALGAEAQALASHQREVPARFVTEREGVRYETFALSPIKTMSVGKESIKLERAEQVVVVVAIASSHQREVLTRVFAEGIGVRHETLAVSLTKTMPVGRESIKLERAEVVMVAMYRTV
jgi:hypothetical protein